MKMGLFKVMSAIVAMLPASAQVLASVNPRAEVDSTKATGLLANGSSLRLKASALNEKFRASLSEHEALVNEEILSDAVFGLDAQGNLQIIGSKEEIKNLMKENRKLKRQIIEARDVLPTSG